MVQGYCPYFLSAVANFGRTHHDQRGQRLRDIEKPAQATYFKHVKDYRRNLISGRAVHSFRNGHSEVINEIRPENLWSWRKNIWRHRILRSRLFRADAYTLALKIKERIKR
jgi:hypothetical protein